MELLKFVAGVVNGEQTLATVQLTDAVKAVTQDVAKLRVEPTLVLSRD
jgi:hypothetical protein